MTGLLPGRRTVLATLWFVLLALVSTGPALFLDRTLGPESMLDSDPLFSLGNPTPWPLISDASRTVYDLPRDFAAAEGLRAGRLDLWNPRVGLGMPLWAEGGALFFPLKLPFYLAPSQRTYDLAAALRLVVAGLGAYLLARWRGLAAVPALAAGSLFELSGAMTTTLPYGFGAPPSLLPWVLLGAEAIARERRPVAAAGAGIALGVAANSGHPMMVLVVFAGFGAAILGHALVAWQRPRVALLIGALACLAVALGLALGAPALLPTLEALLAGRSYKTSPAHVLRRWLALNFSRHAMPVALFLPGLLVPLQAGAGTAFPHAVESSVGVVGLLLALAGLLRGGLDAPLVAVALLGIGMTLAPPGLGWVSRLPLLTFVYATYSWTLVVLPLTQAAGRGVAVLATAPGRRAVVAALALVLIGIVAVLLVNRFASEGGLLEPGMRRALMAALDRPGGWLRLALPVALATAVTAWIIRAAPSGVTRRGAAVVVALASGELLATVAPTVWWRDSKVLASPPSPAVRFLQEHLDGGESRMLGASQFIGFPSTPSLFGLPDIRAVEALPAERYVRYLEVIKPSVDWFFMQHPGGVTRHPLLDLAAVRYVVTGGSPEPRSTLDDDPAVRLVYRDAGVAIYENTAALPRARVAHTAIPVRDAAEAVIRLSEAAAVGSHAADVGLGDGIVVEPSADGHAAPVGPRVSAPPGEDVRLVDRGDPDRVELVASLAAPGWVVLADTFYPGWTATIDGAAAPIHPADLLFRAVFVPAGQHQIVFQYTPRAFRLGLALAALGLAASGILVVREAIRRLPLG